MNNNGSELKVAIMDYLKSLGHNITYRFTNASNNKAYVVITNIDGEKFDTSNRSGATSKLISILDEESDKNFAKAVQGLSEQTCKLEESVNALQEVCKKLE